MPARQAERPTPPDLSPQLRAADAAIPNAAALDESGVAFTGLDLRMPEPTSIRLEGCTLDRCTLAHAKWRSATLLDIRFTACDLANITLAGARLSRVEFIDCRLTGADFSDASLNDVRFEACRLDLSLFFATSAMRTTFNGCDLRQSEFQSANLTSPIFRNCDLSEAVFSGTDTLTRADLRGSRLHECRISPETILNRGITIDPAQATNIAELFGISVRPSPTDLD